MSDRLRVGCIDNKCSDQAPTLLNWQAADAYMDEHVREVAHDPRWPVTFRLRYLAQPVSQAPFVAYRAPVKVPPCCDAATFEEHLENHCPTDTADGL